MFVSFENYVLYNLHSEVYKIKDWHVWVLLRFDTFKPRIHVMFRIHSFFRCFLQKHVPMLMF